LLLITVTAWPLLTNVSVSGLPMFPSEPVSTMFMFCFFC
jgi:hypothetical protein